MSTKTLKNPKEPKESKVKDPGSKGTPEAKRRWKEYQKQVRKQIKERAARILAEYAEKKRLEELKKNPPPPPPPPDPETARTLSEMIRSRGMKQEHVAKQVGRHPSYISLLCSGKRVPSLRTSRRFADLLGVSLDRFQRLLEGSGTEKGLETVEIEGGVK